jgi:hypothetical protein
MNCTGLDGADWERGLWTDEMWVTGGKYTRTVLVYCLGWCGVAPDWMGVDWERRLWTDETWVTMGEAHPHLGYSESRRRVEWTL